LNSLKSALVSDEAGSRIAEDITSQRRNNESRDLEQNNKDECSYESKRKDKRGERQEILKKITKKKTKFHEY